MEFDGSILSQCTDGIKLATGAEHKHPMTLHCQQCHVVLGDSFFVCGEIKCIDSIMCLRVTDDVVVDDAMESRHKGEMAGCIYSLLKCRGCRAALGKVIHSAPARFAAVRYIFLLNKANISCYILNSSSLVKASTLTFDMKPLKESFNEVKKQFEVQFDQMSSLKIRLTNRSGTGAFGK